MAGFSDYRSFQSPQDQVYNSSRYGYNFDYSSPPQGQVQGAHGFDHLTPVDLDPLQPYSSRRNLHLNFNSAQSNNSHSPDSPDDSTVKSFAYRGIGLMGLVADHLLSHPLLVLRRQCQVHVQSTRYHLFPVTLIYPAVRICQWQGLSVLWKGLGSTLVVKGMTLAVEDITSKITPWPKEISRHGSLKSFFQHILLKSVSLAVITPFYSASLVETVQSEVASETAGFFDVFREGFWRLLSWPHTGRMVPLHILVIPTVAHGILSYIIYASIKSVSLSTIKRVRESKERKQGALSKDSDVSYYMEMTASLVGHMVADVLLFPLETILHRLHLQGTRTIIDNLDTGLEVTPIITSYSGVLDCVRTTIEEEGFSGLYKGFGALVLQYGLQILLIRTVKIVLEKNPFGSNSIDKSYPPSYFGNQQPLAHHSVSEPTHTSAVSSRSSPPSHRSPIKENYGDPRNLQLQAGYEETSPDRYSSRLPRSRLSKYDLDSSSADSANFSGY